MAKKIEWLENFAETYSKEMKKTAGKIQKEDVIVDKSIIAGAKLGEVVKFQGRLYKVADLDFEDEKGPGVVLNEVGPDVPTGDPMSMSMGTEVSGLTNGQAAQEYARTNPGDVYHYEIRDEVEQAAFEQAAAETASQIEKERAFDRSTVDGHYTTPKNMGGALPTSINPVMEEMPIEEELVELPIEEELVELPVEEELVELPIEEELVEEELTEEESIEEELMEEEKEPVIGRHNRILRRIMASK